MSDPLTAVAVTDEGEIEVTHIAPPQVSQDSSVVETAALQGMLNITHPTSKELGQLKEVWDFLAEKANGIGDLLHQFRQLEARMSPPKLGENRLGKVHSYVKLQQQIQEAEKYRDSL